jgi:hypothetical protein
MKPKSVKLAAILLTCVATWLPRPAVAQLTVGANTNVINIGVVLIGNDIAYDPDHDIYLSVAAYGGVYGVFVSPSGAPAGAPFGIGSAGAASYGHYPRAIYSHDLNGGNGGFLVTWHQADGYLHSVVIASPSGVISAERLISDGGQGGTRAGGNTGLAYSPTSHRFLVTWTTGAFGIQGRFLDSSGVPSGAVTQYVDAGGAQEPQLAWNSATDDFGLIHGGFNSVVSWVGFRRIPASGASPTAPTLFGYAAGTFSPSIAVNTSTHHYILGWSLGGGAKGTEFDQNGFKVADERFLASRLGTPTSFELAYNPVSNTLLAVSEDPLSIEVAGIELNPDGSPISIAVGLSSGATSGSFVPRLTARTKTREWSISYARNMNALANQIISTGTTGGSPGPTPCTLSINDTSASIPGGTYTGSLAISAPVGCNWTASSQASWLSASPGSGSGAGTVQWAAQANSAAGARSGSIVITSSGGSQTLTVNQAAYAARLGDFNGDSSLDLVWQNRSTGDLAWWRMTGFNRMSGDPLSPSRVGDTGWKIVATLDMDRDGYTDLLWQHDSGYVAVWRMRGTTLMSGELITQSPLSDTGWHIVGAGDVDKDGYADIVWQHNDGRVAVWYMRGTTFLAGDVIVQSLSDQGWRVVGVADMNNDGYVDLVWHNSNTGAVALWLMKRMFLSDGRLLNESAPDTNWRIRALGDFDNDGDMDVIWQNDATGALAAWIMNGISVQNGMLLNSTVPDTNWKIVGPR